MMDFPQVLQLFLKELSARGYTARTCEGYRQRMPRFLDYLKATGVSQLGDLTSEVLLGYQAHVHERRGMHGRRLCLGSQLHELGMVRTFCRFLLQRRLILTDPSRDLVMPKVERRLPATILTTREVLQFLKAIDTRTALGVRDRAIFETLYSTAIRVGELVAVTRADVDLEEGFLRVRRGKGGKARVVPLGQIAARWIRRHLEASSATAGGETLVFLSCRGRPLTRDVLSALVRQWARVAGLKKRITCHTWRHTCATHMLKGRATLRHIQELLGHARITTTQIYTHVSILDLKRVHQKCHPRSR